MSETVSEMLSAEQPVEQPLAAVVQGVGSQLKAAREAKHLQVADVAQTLKLGQRQVEALENGDWQVLPGQTFIRGFVRNYARLVMIDSAPLMLQLDAVLQRPVDSLVLPETKPGSVTHASFGPPGRDRLVIVAGFLLVGLAGAVYLLLPNDLSALRNTTQAFIDSLARKDAPAEPVVVAQPAPAEPVFPPGSTPQQVMTPQALAPADSNGQPVAAVGEAPLRFVIDKESWIEVRDRDDKVLFSQRSPSGSEQSVSGQGPLSLVIGNAPGVKLYLRGQAVDLAPHTRGDVARLVLE